MYFHPILQFLQTFFESGILINLINFLIQIIKDQQPKDSPNLANYLDFEYLNPPIWCQLATWFHYKKPISMPFPLRNFRLRPGSQRFFFWTLTSIFQYPIIRTVFSFIQFLLTLTYTDGYTSQFTIQSSIPFTFYCLELISLTICFYSSTLLFTVIHSDLMFPLVGASINPSTQFCSTFTYLFIILGQTILISIINQFKPIEIMPQLDSTSDAVVLCALLESVEMAVFTVITVITIRVIDKGIPPYYMGGFQYPPMYVALIDTFNIWKDIKQVFKITSQYIKFCWYYRKISNFKVSEKFKFSKSESVERLNYPQPSYKEDDDLKVPSSSILRSGSLAKPQSAKFPGRSKPSFKSNKSGNESDGDDDCDGVGIIEIVD